MITIKQAHRDEQVEALRAEYKDIRTELLKRWRNLGGADSREQFRVTELCWLAYTAGRIGHSTTLTL